MKAKFNYTIKKDMKVKPVTIITPKKFLLDGLIFGNPKSKNIYIYLHGLTGNVFNHINLFEGLVKKDYAVLAFNNRGSGLVNKIYQINPNAHKSIIAGMAHEVFTDCVDDIEGAIKLAVEMGGKNIYLLGHSTGCQKSIYYLAKNNNPKVKGAILLAPLSDYADTYKNTDKKVYDKAVAVAKKMLTEGREHHLMPSNAWPDVIDAQRFLSLYTPESEEEIFSYASNRKPKLMQKVYQPILVVLAEKDEYMERPVEDLASWFGISLSKQEHEIEIIKTARHDFSNNIDDTAKVINKWVK
jgi:alpha-beta hydrolase superfamily lysophospholipase